MKKYKLPVIFGVCATPYSMTVGKPHDPVTPAIVMRRVIDSTYGGMYWRHSCSDGIGIDKGEVALFKHRDGILLIIINQSQSEKMLS